MPRGDQQQTIDWDAATWTNHLVRCGLPPVQVALAWLVSRGEELHDGRRWVQSSKRCLAKEIGCSANAVPKAAAQLHDRGYLEIWDSPRRGESPVYVLDVGAIRSLQPLADQIREAAENGPGWAPVGTGGHRPRAVREHTSKIRVPRVSCCASTGPVPSGDQVAGHQVPRVSGGEWERERWWARPWATRGGMPDEVLVQCVATCDLVPLRNLWKHSQETGRAPLRPSDDDALRFLTAAHHCATVVGLNNRMAGLSARVRRDPIDMTNVRHASDRWAAQVMAKRHGVGVAQTS